MLPTVEFGLTFGWMSVYYVFMQEFELLGAANPAGRVWCHIPGMITRLPNSLVKE